MRVIYTSKHWLHDTRDLVIDGQRLVIEETPERAEIIRAAIQNARLAAFVEPEDGGLQPLLAVHTAAYLEFLSHIYAAGREFYGTERPLLPETFCSRAPRRIPTHPIGQLGYYSFGTASPILPGTWEAAYWSAQCALTAARLVEADRQTTYALCRPPGHHAGSDLYGGFCYLNNAAIAARSLQGRVAILDIDFHHGNGTQEIFYTDPRVLCCSLHADPDQDYPYFWGAADERGAGPGLGATLNVPLPLGTQDAGYLAALDHCLGTVRDFNPEFLILSVGLDIMKGDPAGGFHITPAGLGEIARRIAGLTRQGLSTVILQEGGYKLDTLGEDAVTFLRHFN